MPWDNVMNQSKRNAMGQCNKHPLKDMSFFKNKK